MNEVRGQVLFCAFRLVGLYKILKKQETRLDPVLPSRNLVLCPRNLP